MVGWHHQLDGREFEQAVGGGDGQGGLACCSPWCCKESDMTEPLNWTELKELEFVSCKVIVGLKYLSVFWVCRIPSLLVVGLRICQTSSHFYWSLFLPGVTGLCKMTQRRELLLRDITVFFVVFNALWQSKKKNPGNGHYAGFAWLLLIVSYTISFSLGPLTSWRVFHNKR